MSADTGRESMDLGDGALKAGRHAEALEHYRAAVEREPQAWSAWEKLGQTQAGLRNFAEAATDFGRAAGLKPNDPSLLFKWARASFDSGLIEAAERILRDAARLAPNHEAIFRLGCEIFAARSKWATLERLAASWTQAQPKNAEAWRWLAKSQWETGFLRLAMRNFQTSLELGARDAASLAAFGSLCLSALEFDSAVKALDEAEALDPANSQLLSARAVQLMMSGRYEEAESYCRRSLAANRNDASAYKALTQLLAGHLASDDFESLQALAGRDDIPVQDRITAAFALADCLDARGEIERAFSMYERANRLSHERAQSEANRYDPAARKRQIDDLISMFGSAPRRVTAEAGPTPVFIVGMPRSGTTLIESVIGAHSQVFACGERAALRWIMQEFLAGARERGLESIPEIRWKEWHEFYWREMPDRRGATVVTDKNPWNFDALGLIPRLFPGARIIHVRRNPVENGLSIYRNEFNKLLPITNRLEDIGHYYGEYARLMAHWERVLGDRFVTVQYEEFLADTDAASRALLAACGLAWEEGCREYWKSKRVISTMSTMQARRPPARSAGRAMSYAAHLAPLTGQLRAAGVNLEIGAAKSTPNVDANGAPLV